MIMFEGHKRLAPQLPVCPCLGEDHGLFSEENFDPAWMEVAEKVYSSTLAWLLSMFIRQCQKCLWICYLLKKANGSFFKE